MVFLTMLTDKNISTFLLRIFHCILAFLILCLSGTGPIFAGFFSVEPVSEISRIYKASHALVIGVSDYDRDTGWNDLPGVKTDVGYVVKALELSGFEVSPPILDPNREALRSGITDFIDQYGRDFDHRLLVYFAGHGVTLEWEDGRKMGYVVPADVATPGSSDGSSYEAVSMQWVEQQALQIASKHVLFVFDSCYSGSIFRVMQGMPEITSDIATLASNSARQFITAGAEDQEVPDESIFRQWFETALSGSGDLNRDGFITGTELGIFLRKNVSVESNASQTPQFARMLREGFTDGDFIFESPIGLAANDLILDSDLTPALEGEAPGAWSRFRDCRQCPEMTVVPAGRFQFGSPEDDSYRHDDEYVQSVQVISSAFAMSVFEITTEQWNACFNEGGCLVWKPVSVDGGSREPVAGITWQDAQQYLSWLKNKTSLEYRLPTEVEWEYAARAGSVSARPWGEDIRVNYANCAGCGSEYDGWRPAPVGSFSANRFGLYDMLGNVWEWVDDCYENNNVSESADVECANRVLRGGSYVTASDNVRSASRGKYPGDRAQVNFGFRVVRVLQ